MSDSGSDDSIDQLEQFRRANVKPGMFVSGWEDPNDEVYETPNPRGNLPKNIFYNKFFIKFDCVCVYVCYLLKFQKHCKKKFCGQ